MFRRLPENERALLRLTVDGRAIEARAGDTVMAALLAAGVVAFRRSPVDGAPRGPFCGMGACFECLVTIDGAGARQACLVLAREGQAVETGAGRRDLGGNAA